nr:uncharacterized protein LOC108946449 [Nicotiana tomentosiformis]
MDNGDKSWMGLRRSTDEYIRGVSAFLDKAFERAFQENKILCPCKKYFNRYWHYRNVVEDHLVAYGFTHGYTKCVFHGEGFSSRNMPHPTNDDDGSDMHDDINGLLHDTFRNVEGDLSHEGVREGPFEDEKRFFKLVEEEKQELYPGCKNFSKLDFTIRLFLFKCIHGLSNVAFSDLLDLIKEAFPFAKLPKSFHKEKKIYCIDSFYLQKSSKINKENRKYLTDPHTVGKTSFAVIHNELEKTKESVSLKEIFVATRARKLGRLYKDSDENTTSKIAEMEKIETQQSVDGSQSVDAFSSIMGPENPGHLRLYGRGVTKTTLKGKVIHSNPTSNATNDTVQEMQERIRKMEEQKRTMRQEITIDIIAQLQRARLINPNILATLSVSSLGEATSAPQAANQLIHRPSTSSNNQD